MHIYWQWWHQELSATGWCSKREPTRRKWWHATVRGLEALHTVGVTHVWGVVKPAKPRHRKRRARKLWNKNHFVHIFNRFSSWLTDGSADLTPPLMRTNLAVSWLKPINQQLSFITGIFHFQVSKMFFNQPANVYTQCIVCKCKLVTDFSHQTDYIMPALQHVHK